MPSSVWNLSPPSSPSTSAADRLGLIAGGLHLGDELEFRHASRAYREGATAFVDRSAAVAGGLPLLGPRGLGRLGSRGRGAPSSGQISSIWRSRCARSPELSTTHVATARRSSSVACSAIRRSASSRGTPRASRRCEPHLAAAPRPRSPRRSRSPASTPRAAERRARRSRRAGAAATWRRNSSPIAGCVIASSCLRVSSVDERPLGERGPVERRRRAARISGPNASTSAASAGLPGSTTSRAIASASTTTAPRVDEHPRHRRLARPDPAREPDHQHAGESTSAGRRTQGRADRARAQDTLAVADIPREAST